MKVKGQVEDFRVEEQVALRPSAGPFALYRLTKRSLGTPEAIDAIARRWNVARADIAFAGLKDKHALTTQYVTIRGGPRRELSQTNLELEYLGQVERAIHASDITANRFVVVIRDLGPNDLQKAIAALTLIARDGLPNYFDSQRFGSLGKSGEFIARPWCLGDYERALWLALADENVHDRPVQREERRILRIHWGNLWRCHNQLKRFEQKEVLGFLVGDPPDYRRAIALVRQDLRSLWLAAFQSHVWNQVLAGLIQQVCGPENCAYKAVGPREVPFFADLNESQRNELHAASLPLPSARLHLGDSPLNKLYDQALAAEGMKLPQMRVKYPRDSFFSKGERAAVVQPAALTHEIGDDDLHPGRKKLTLSFSLPRGSYATILVKRVTGFNDTLGDEAE